MYKRQGLRVQLPEQGVAQALQALMALQASDQVMDRDVSAVSYTHLTLPTSDLV